MENLKIFSGLPDYDLAKKIAGHLGRELNKIEITRFADGEERIQFQENIRDCDVFLIQPTMPPAENLFRLVMMIDAAKRASARRITAVMPYYGYARQDRKDKPRVPITAKVVAKIVQSIEVDRILTIDLHVNQIEGFFDIPVDHLYARPVFVNEFRKITDKRIIGVAPDAGSVNRTSGLAQRLGDNPIVYVHKKRAKDNQAEIVRMIGDIEPEDRAIITDDIIDTGRTVANVIRAISDHGVKEIILAGVHALLSQEAIEKLADSPVSHVYITNTIPLSHEKLERIEKYGLNKRLTVLSVHELFAEAIRIIHTGKGSISSLFE